MACILPDPDFSYEGSEQCSFGKHRHGKHDVAVGEG